MPQRSRMISTGCENPTTLSVSLAALACENADSGAETMSVASAMNVRSARCGRIAIILSFLEFDSLSTDPQFTPRLIIFERIRYTESVNPAGSRCQLLPVAVFE